MKEHHPGVLSDELKTALGMPSEGVPVPPPWLINMQRYGPPPSYPNLKIPGLNAPIPPGAQFGYHPGKPTMGSPQISLSPSLPPSLSLSLSLSLSSLSLSLSRSHYLSRGAS